MMSIRRSATIGEMSNMPILGMALRIGPKIGSVASFKKCVSLFSSRTSQDKMIRSKIRVTIRSARMLMVCLRKSMEKSYRMDLIRNFMRVHVERRGIRLKAIC